MIKNYPVILALALTATALAGCAPVHYKHCNLTCFAKPKPVSPPPVPAPAPVLKPLVTPAPIMKTILVSKPITIRGINFATGSYRLDSSDDEVVRHVAEFASKHPEALLEIKGYCSHTGSYEYNLKLSQQRAEAVAQRLQQMGIPASAMITKGYSWNDPVASNRTAQGRYLNQRVTIDSTLQETKKVSEG